jgi:hypothetical protein
MKNLYPVFSILMLMACGSTKVEIATDYNTLSFSLDTVMVDPGQEILFLREGISISDLSEDKRYLFNFNMDEHSIEKINLDNLVLEEKFKFEEEGPNGTGEFLSSMQVYNEQVFLSGYNSVGLFNFSGEKAINYSLKGVNLQGDSLKADESFSWKMILDHEGKYLYGTITNYTSKKISLGKLDVDNKILKKIPIKSFDKMAYYHFSLQSMMLIMPDMDLIRWEDKLILSNSVSSELSWFDFHQDTLFSKTYQSKLTADSKKGKYRNEVETAEELEKEEKAMREEINFMTPFWDEVNQRFYRFSYEELDIEVDLENGEKNKSKVYLTILDKDLNLLGESPVPVLNHKPGKHFAKDGKIWMLVNVEDEMGFARLSID